jgi:hypothetical protein
MARSCAFGGGEGGTGSMSIRSSRQSVFAGTESEACCLTWDGDGS